MVLEQPVLVLNRLWQAVNICSTRRALSMLYEGNAQVVHSEEGHFNTFSFNEWADFSEQKPEQECVNGVSIKLRLPKVVLLMVYDRMPRKEVKFTRHNIFQRDKNTCQYCGNKFDALSIGPATNWGKKLTNDAKEIKQLAKDFGMTPEQIKKQL